MRKPSKKVEKKPKIHLNIKYLLDLAVKTLNHSNYSRKLVKTIVLLTQKYQIRLSKIIKRNICFECFRILIPSINSKSRLSKEKDGMKLIITCECGISKNFVLKGEKGHRNTNTKRSRYFLCSEDQNRDIYSIHSTQKDS
ncbi:putative RNAse P [Hamiltosporidium tvaerminnensis]|uniref:Putative RNAse P n=2 Tax=Hamiltosporidium TaxID=1176354 RepID=A0A4Q9KUX3_9MICR|nr:putative RNAse P [Hamiltosporidium tvaerminnensis]TBU08817.1 putative RNAse P [Hamiltosporidium magnivora]TBU20125.1 putative RNAse P [Hamiltosporidium tvaerminnensis]